MALGNRPIGITAGGRMSEDLKSHLNQMIPSDMNGKQNSKIVSYPVSISLMAAAPNPSKCNWPKKSPLKYLGV